MNKKIIILVTLLIVVLSSVSVGAFDLETNIGKRGGYASYTINDDSDSWQSLLEFPLDYATFETTYYAELNTDKIKSFKISYLTNISDESNDPFIDSDWTTTEGEGEPDIYAEANSKVNMSEIDLKVLLNYNFISNKKAFLGGGFGYKSSDHNFLISGPGYQRDNVNETEYSFSPEEELLEYNLEIKAPYLLLSSKGKYFECDLKLYPKVSIYDFDHHILRGKYNESDSSGDGFEFDIKYKKDLTDSVKVNVQLNYEVVNGEGTQVQWFEDNDNVYNVDHKLEYEQKSVMAGLTYSF